MAEQLYNRCEKHLHVNVISHCTCFLRSNLLGGIDPLLISCWACLTHDLLTVAQRETTLTVSDIIKHIADHASDLQAEVESHKGEYVDAGVPVAPCLANLIMPSLRSAYPEKLKPKDQTPSKKEDQTGNLTQGSASDCLAVSGRTSHTGKPTWGAGRLKSPGWQHGGQRPRQKT